MTPAKISRLVSDLAYTQGFLEGVQKAYELTKSLDLEMAPLDLSGPAKLLHGIIEELKQEALSGFSTNGETKQESEMPPETRLGDIVHYKGKEWIQEKMDCDMQGGFLTIRCVAIDKIHLHILSKLNEQQCKINELEVRINKKV